jgi:lambda family phage portal protein
MAARVPKRSTPMQAAARRAELAELKLRTAQAQAEASYYGAANQQFAMMQQRQAEGGVPTRLSGEWPLFVGNDQGNYSWQDLYEIGLERSRSRSLEQTNWLAAAVMDRTLERVIGTKIVVEPRTESVAFNDEVRRWLKTSWYTRACDIRGIFTFSRICHLLYRAKMRDGDAGLLLTEDPQGNPKLQLIEAQRIKTPGNADDLQGIATRGNQIVDGIEMDPNGAHVAYWVATQATGKAPVWERVLERDFLFQFRTSRYTHVRGEPAFRGGYWLFDQIMGYFEAVTVAARIGASAAMIAKRKNPGTPEAPNAMGARSRGRAGATPGPGTSQVPIVPGMINVIGIDEDLVAFNPAQPTQSFPESIATFCRFIGIRFGLTLEDTLLDFSRTTYSSSKAARAAARAAADVEQEDFSVNVVTRVYQWALSKAVKNGTIKTPPPENFWDHEWLPPVWPSVEPLKDIQAAERGVALGVESRSNYAAMNGYDFAELCVQNGKDQATMVANGLSTVIAVGNNGAQQAEGTKDAPPTAPQRTTPPRPPQQTPPPPPAKAKAARAGSKR